MPLLTHRLSRRFFVKGASAAAAAGALTLQAQAAQADEANNRTQFDGESGYRKAKTRLVGGFFK